MKAVTAKIFRDETVYFQIICWWKRKSQEKWKTKQNIELSENESTTSKFVSHMCSGPEIEIYRTECIPQNLKKSQINNLSSHLRLRKKWIEHTKSKRKKVNNKYKSKTQWHWKQEDNRKKTSETSIWFFQKISKTDNL